MERRHKYSTSTCHRAWSLKLELHPAPIPGRYLMISKWFTQIYSRPFSVSINYSSPSDNFGMLCQWVRFTVSSILLWGAERFSRTWSLLLRVLGRLLEFFLDLHLTAAQYTSVHSCKSYIWRILASRSLADTPSYHSAVSHTILGESNRYHAYSKTKPCSFMISGYLSRVSTMIWFNTYTYSWHRRKHFLGLKQLRPSKVCNWSPGDNERRLTEDVK